MATLREAVIGDEAAVAQVHVRSWQVGYRGLIDDERLEGMKAAQRVGSYRFASQDPRAPRTLLAVEGELVVGFVTWGASDDREGASDEILALYVDPAHWRRGVATQLLEGAIAALGQEDVDRIYLWVLEGNRRAEAFYVARGWTFDGVSRRETIWDVSLSANRFSRRLGASAEDA